MPPALNDRVCDLKNGLRLRRGADPCFSQNPPVWKESGAGNDSIYYHTFAAPRQHAVRPRPYVQWNWPRSSTNLIAMSSITAKPDVIPSASTITPSDDGAWSRSANGKQKMHLDRISNLRRWLSFLPHLSTRRTSFGCPIAHWVPHPAELSLISSSNQSIPNISPIPHGSDPAD